VDKEKYLETLKTIDLRPKFKRVTESDDIEEGVVRGVATIPYRIIKGMAVWKDWFGALKNPIDRVNYIKKQLSQFKTNLKLMDLKLDDSKHSFLKSLDKIWFWRFYVILNDKVYNTFVQEILTNPPDVKIVNKWADVRFSQREIPEIYNVKHTDDLVKVIDKYISRVEEIGKLVQKYPDKKKNLNDLLLWGIYGIRDLITATHAVASYGAK